MEGYLQKWTNYVFGWQRRYFTLESGVLTYSKSMNSPKLGVIHLDVSQIFKHQTNPKRLYIDSGLTMIHLKAESEQECNEWFSALLVQKTSTSQYSQKNEIINLISEKIAEINSIHAQILAEADILPLNVIKTTPGLERAIALCEEMKDMASETLIYIETQEDFIVQTEEFQIDQPKLQQAEFDFDESGTFVDAKSEFSDRDEDFGSSGIYRKTLPFLRDPNQRINIWKVIRESIGLELSRIAVPVYFNEPLSFLQRFSEDLSYNSIILNACSVEDSALRLGLISCFIISTYASSDLRSMKPFNPLLGETFELQRDGFRLISEQVSHHPPISAIHCDHPAYTFYASTEVKTSFKGTYLSVNPTGKNHLILKSTKDHFVWEKPFTNVHNIIIGKIYVEHYGNVEVVNESTGEKAVLDFKKRGWFDRSSNDVTGIVYDVFGNEKWRLIGKWNKGMKVVNIATGQEVQAWELYPLPDKFEYNYFFSEYALQLNIPPEHFGNIPRTDSRWRPDQRALENGNITQATNEKLRLEEKQRAVRKIKEKNHEHHEPRWFAFENSEWKYQGEYWPQRDSGTFTNIPDIF